MKINEGLVTKPMRGALVAGLLAISYVGTVSAASVVERYVVVCRDYLGASPEAAQVMPPRSCPAATQAERG